MSVLFCLWVRDERGRDDHYSARRSRSVSRSISPRDERNYRSNQRSPRRSRSISEPFSPREERNSKSSKRARDGIKCGRTPVNEDYVHSRSHSPRENSRSLSRSRSRSWSYRCILCFFSVCYIYFIHRFKLVTLYSLLIISAVVVYPVSCLAACMIFTFF